MKYQRILFSLIQRAARDPEFRAAWGCVAEAECKFLPLRESLTAEQDDLVDEYLLSRELLGMTFSAVAYEMGVERGKQAAAASHEQALVSSDTNH